MKRLLKGLLAALMIVMTCWVNITNVDAASYSELEAKIVAFIHDDRWKDGVSWNGSQRSKLATGYAVGCYSYSNDFVKYVHNYNNITNGRQFTDTAEIVPGDVLHFVDSYSQHWLSVIGRQGNSIIYCDGNSSSRVTVGHMLTITGSHDIAGVWGTYGGNMSFSEGYHFTDVKDYPETTELTGSLEVAERDGGYRIKAILNANKICNMETTVSLYDEYGTFLTSFDFRDTSNNITQRYVTTDERIRKYLKTYRRYYAVMEGSCGWASENFTSEQIAFGENRLDTVAPFSSGLQDLGDSFDAIIYRNYDKKLLCETDRYYSGSQGDNYVCRFTSETDGYTNQRNVDSKYLFHFEKQEDGTYIITSARGNYLSNSGGEFSIWDEVYGNGSKQTHWGVYGEKGNYFLSPVETSGLIIYKNIGDYSSDNAVLRMFDNPELDYVTTSLSIRQPGLLQETGTDHDNGHYFTAWQYNGRIARTHTHTCTLDHFTETLPCEFDEGVTDGKVTTYTCRICGGSYNEVSLANEGITRVAGTNRFGTAMSIADTFKDNQKRESLDTVILACSSNFADALAGSYLAAVKNAPILLTNADKAAEINAYVKKVLKKDGTVYVLGGTAAVPRSCLKGLDGFLIKRLAGNNRYETNLAILNEAGVDTDIILVGTGKNFADSLSASATGLPLLLVKDGITYDLYYFMVDHSDKTYVILGGTGAVNSEIEEIITNWIGKCERLAGATRYETSKLIAERFFPEATSAVIAYASDFPDGLCGGPLSFQIGAPLLLTGEGKDKEARHFMRDHGIKDGYVLGGTARLSDELVRKVFYLNEEDPIKSVNE